MEQDASVCAPFDVMNGDPNRNWYRSGRTHMQGETDWNSEPRGSDLGSSPIMPGPRGLGPFPFPGRVLPVARWRRGWGHLPEAVSSARAVLSPPSFNGIERSRILLKRQVVLGSSVESLNVKDFLQRGLGPVLVVGEKPSHRTRQGVTAADCAFQRAAQFYDRFDELLVPNFIDLETGAVAEVIRREVLAIAVMTRASPHPDAPEPELVHLPAEVLGDRRGRSKGVVQDCRR